MDNILKTLQVLEELLEKAAPLKPQIQQATNPIKPIRPIKTTTTPPKIPGVNPPSAKNPVKVAEQIPDAATREAKIKQVKPMLKFNPLGQWQIDGEQA